MSVRVKALAGETVDALVWRAIGTRGGTVESVLAANPGLAAADDVLAEGTEVVVPTPTAQAPKSSLIQLWS